MNWLSVASINMAIAVMCGAFGAHGLKAQLSTEQMAWWQTGTQYYFYQALGLFIIALLIRLRIAPSIIAWLLQAGILLFTGSLYLMALGASRGLGMITPIGGTLMIIAWLWLAVVVAKNSTWD